MRAYVFKTNNGYDFVKADSLPGSRQLDADVFEQHYGPLGLIRPPYSLDTLSSLYELDTWHRRATMQKAWDATGMGWEVVKDPHYTGEASEEDRMRLVEFFSTCSVDQPLEDLLHSVWVDYDVLGNAGLEVVTDGTGTPVELYHVPFKTMRVHRSQRLFAQIRGTDDHVTQVAWFVDYGHDPANVKNVPGQEVKFPFDPSDAGQFIHLKAYDSRSSFYGLPEAISATGAISANMYVHDYNIGRLANRGVPDYIMTLSGVELDSDTQAQIKEFLDSAKRKSLKEGPKVLSLEVGPNGTANFEKLTPDTEDANWLAFRRDNRDEVLAAHGMPKYRIGVSETGSLGQNVAAEQSRIYSMSVVRPRRQRMEHILNSRIISKGFGIKGWRIEFNELDIRNEQAEAEADYRRTAGVPVETINEIRRKRNLGPDLNGGNRVMMRVGHEIIQVAHIPGSVDGGGDDYPHLPGVKRPEDSQEIPHLAGRPDVGQSGTELTGPDLFPQDTPYTNVPHLD